MKGPGYRYDIEVRRKWECPACGRQMLLPGHLTQKECHCRDEPTWMTLIEVDWRRTFPEREKIVIPDDPPVEPDVAVETPVEETIDEVPSPEDSQATEPEESALSTGDTPKIDEPEAEKAPDRKPDLVLGAVDTPAASDSETDTTEAPPRKRRRKKRRRNKGGSDKQTAPKATTDEAKTEAGDASSSSESETTNTTTPATSEPPQANSKEPDNNFGSGV